MPPPIHKILIIAGREDILRKCAQHSIDAVIPGYGFLSENVQFAQNVVEAGMIFVGPSASSITEMGLKHRAREVAISSGVPVVPGTALLESEAEALAAAERLGFPVLDLPLFIYIGMMG